MEELNAADIEPPGADQKIPLTCLIPPTKENNFIYKNGLSKYLDKLVVKVYSNIEVCQQLWEQFSPNQSLFQLWEFRYAWYLGFQYTPYFYTIQMNKDFLGVLPLWFNKEKKQYEWFGGTWPEDNIFFVTDNKFIPLLLKIMPKPIFLNALLFSQDLLRFDFPDDEIKYVHHIEQYRSIDDFLSSLPKKNRYHMRNFYHRFEQLEPQVIFSNDDFSRELKILKKLSIIDYERKDISEYRKNERMNTFREIYRHRGRYQIITLYGKIRNYDLAFDIIAVYKNQFYILTGAADIERFPGAIHYLTYLEVEKAIQMGCKTVDAMQVDYNWKHKYFTSQPMLMFEKK
jgi:hypothetical protein